MDLGETLVALYPKMLRYAISLTRNKDTAEDLVMDVISKLLEKGDELGDDINVESYAIRSIKNKFIDSTRYKNRFVDTSSLDTEESTFLDTVIDEHAELKTTSGLERRDLSRALCAVGEECLEILTLFGVGNSYKEISERLDTAIGTVMSRMSRCRSRLQLKLEEA